MTVSNIDVEDAASTTTQVWEPLVYSMPWLERALIVGLLPNKKETSLRPRIHFLTLPGHDGISERMTSQSTTGYMFVLC